ncbi:DUF4129 domain-containing protein [Deinococcus aquaticus]|uniref:DUF4129 domain-containing protein n=1 Tax=Deinococcus aquaticus TaxID=328692 RepID=A0ABY7V2W1_9DEIO|nr:DUF4129 domain-containing protein [Deinococcus aquaticus]WDA58286.1 DUF4129 domain-containing protein [Deinococcus aquaticus]
MNAAPLGVTVPPWTAFGLALLPLCLAGLLPLWSVAALCALFALGVRWPAWVQARVLGTQLLIGLGMLSGLPGSLGDGAALVRLAGLYLLASLGGFALSAAAHALEDGRRRALLVPLALGLLGPQVGVLLALLGGALARPGPDARRTDLTPPEPARRWWVTLALGVAPLLLLALLLPTPAAGPDGRDVAGSPPVSGAAPDASTSGLAPSSGGRAAGAPLLQPFQPPVILNLGQSGLPVELMLLGGLLLAGAALSVPALRRARGQPPHPAEWLMVAGLLLTGLLWVVAAVLLYLGESGGSAALLPAAREAEGRPGAGGGPASVDAAHVINLSWLMPTLTWATLALVLALAGALLWLRRQGTPDPAPPGDPPEVPADAPATQTAATHRVREAYRAAQTALSTAGWPRSASETPAAYAARLGALHAPLAGPLATLTAAYEPVRYGGRLTDEDATQAEQAADLLTRALPPAPTKDTP